MKRFKPNNVVFALEIITARRRVYEEQEQKTLFWGVLYLQSSVVGIYHNSIMYSAHDAPPWSLVRGWWSCFETLKFAVPVLSQVWGRLRTHDSIVGQDFFSVARPFSGGLSVLQYIGTVCIRPVTYYIYTAAASTILYCMWILWLVWMAPHI